MRGVVPIGVTAPRGATSVTLTGLDAGLPYVFDVRPTRDGDAEMAPHHRLTALTPTQSAPAALGLTVWRPRPPPTRAE